MQNDSSSGPIEAAPAQGASLAGVALTAGLREARRQFERRYIAAVLEHHQWRMADAARALGIERANLYRKTRQLGIRRSGAAAGRQGGRP